MRKKIFILFLLVILLLSEGSFLDAQEIGIAFITGNNFLNDLDENQKLIYIVGLVDMFFYYYYIEYQDIYKIVIKKMSHMSGPQIKKIYEKYLYENPEELHYIASYLFVNAMIEKVLSD
jgi:hypothetical protein